VMIEQQEPLRVMLVRVRLILSSLSETVLRVLTILLSLLSTRLSNADHLFLTSMPTSLIGNSPSVKRVLYTTKLYPHWRRFATCRTFQNGTASLPFHNPGAAVRFGELHSVSKDRYPRIASSPEHVSCLALTARFGKLSPGESCTDTKVTLYGQPTFQTLLHGMVSLV
jgi:hypothetical protein